MADVIDLRAKPDVVLLNEHGIKLSSEYLLYAHRLISIALSLGQKSCYLW